MINKKILILFIPCGIIFAFQKSGFLIHIVNFPNTGLGNTNELAQKVPRKAFIEQGRTGQESGHLYIDYRPGGKREKMPPGNETEDHSRPGFEVVGKRKNFRKSEIETYSPDSLA